MEQVNVKGVVAGYKEFEQLLLINLGEPYPNSPLTLVFKGDAQSIGNPLKVKGTAVIVLGTLINYKGKPEIEITKNDQILLQPAGN